jgi:exocyst complex component 1
MESQLIGADTLEIRQRVDSAYDKIVQTMFDCLQQMAKISDEGEDKGQLNYHVILIGECRLYLHVVHKAYILT